MDVIDREELDTSCDGLFLLLDTAVHNGLQVSDEEIRDHVRECNTCRANGMTEV